MSASDSNETGGEVESDGEDTLLRERIRQDPVPAARWFAVFLVFVLLEFGKFVGGLFEIGSALGFVVGGLTALPGWIRGNVSDTLGTLAGAIASDLASLILLFVVASILTTFVLPWRIVDRVDLDLSRRASVHVEQLIVTAILAVGWFLFVFTPVGAFLQAEFAFLVNQLETLTTVPSLTDRDLISNEGHRTPNGGWEGTFLGLSPAWAWTLRVLVVFLYAYGLLWWLWKGYNVYREHYRPLDWTPRDDFIRRFRSNYWGLFGLATVSLFIILAVWAPSIAAAPVDANIYQPYAHELEFLDENGEVSSVTHGLANRDSRSRGSAAYGPLSYDDFDRWAPLGTTPRGQDMSTHLAFGARTSLIIGLIAIILSSVFAVVMSLVTAYYKGLVDIITIIASDTIISIPALLLIMLLSVIFQAGNHPLAQPMDGGLLLALILAFAYWPGIWRSIRGPSLQVAEEEWVDAAKSYGQSPSQTMKKHMAPYLVSYLLIYASLLLGAVIIVSAALSFLGLGINPPTPEWGRLINDGRLLVATASWHVSTLSGLAIVLVVLGFNALGDALRDAVDPESESGVEEGGAQVAGGGG